MSGTDTTRPNYRKKCLTCGVDDWAPCVTVGPKPRPMYGSVHRARKYRKRERIPGQQEMEQITWL